MSENTSCSGNCESCSGCGEKQDMRAQPHPLSSVKKVIGVVSGKGGVGKSLVSALMAVSLNRRGLHTAVLDADITGPSIPRMFGIKERAEGTEDGLFPARSKTGIDVMSTNMLLENETDPVVWRGPVIAGMVTQFWTNVVWKNVDFMFVDMPPGTGDVPLTVFQSLPVDGIIIVATPQELVSMVVEKAVKMAGLLKIPVLAAVENMAYYTCPDCGKKHYIFGKSGFSDITEKHGIELFAEIPLNEKLSAACDAGMIELFEGDWLDGICEKLERLIEN